jgi:AraC family transcriptional activator FtrA
MPRFEEMYPKVRVQRDVLYVDEGTLLTSAGSAAGIDLCLHLIRRDFGVKAANTVARRMVVPSHREGGQRQFVEEPVLAPHLGERLSPLIEKLGRRLDQQLSVSQLAQEARMSERTFIRRFQATTGMAPGRWITLQRVKRARELLESSKAPIDAIANACGFGDASTLRRHFQAHLGVSPAAYRTQFGLIRC